MPRKNEMGFHEPQIGDCQHAAYEDYFDDFTHHLWLKVLSEDCRIQRAVDLMLFRAQDNDRSVEANLVASVAEEYDLKPEDMAKILEFHEVGLTVNPHG